MAVTSGFFDSVDGDRKYNALQMSSIFDGLIEDGVYNNVGDKFAVTASEGNTVIVGTGRAWFNHGWIVNDADLPIELDPSGVTYDRYDAIILQMDQRSNIRAGNITVSKGNESYITLKPFLIQGTIEGLWEYPIAYIRRKAGSSSISQSDIEYVVGTGECPFVVAAVQSVDIDALLAQWEDQFNQWFENLETQLSGDVAGNLQNQINHKVDEDNVIDDPDQLLLATQTGYVAGAKAAAALFNNLNSKIGFKIVDMQEVVLRYGNGEVSDGPQTEHTCTGYFYSDYDLSDCEITTSFIYGGYVVPMAYAQITRQGSKTLKIDQVYRNISNETHSFLARILVICYEKPQEG